MERKIILVCLKSMQYQLITGNYLVFQDNPFEFVTTRLGKDTYVVLERDEVHTLLNHYIQQSKDRASKTKLDIAEVFMKYGSKQAAQNTPEMKKIQEKLSREAALKTNLEKAFGILDSKLNAYL